jgi:hypothetical protein
MQNAGKTLFLFHRLFKKNPSFCADMVAFIMEYVIIINRREGGREIIDARRGA